MRRDRSLVTRGHHRHVGLGVALIATLVAALCSGCGATPVTSSSSSSHNRTRWQTVLDQIDDEGRATTSTALALFGLAFGPLPGSEIPPGDPGGGWSGSLAVSLLRQHWSEITAEQRDAAVDAVPELGVSDTDALGMQGSGEQSTPTRAHPSARALRASAGLEPPAGSRSEGSHSAEAFGSDAASLFERFLAEMHLPDPGWRPTVRLSTRNVEGDAVAYSSPEESRCPIVLQPSLFAQYGSTDQRFVLAHEAFHCVQGVLAKGVPAWAPWITEGAASWAAEQIAPGDQADVLTRSLYEPLWNPYLSHPERSTYARAYDAFGFFVYLQNAGVDLWSRLTALPVGNSAAFADLTSGARVSTDWPSGFFQDAALGQEWTMDGPGITSTRAAAVGNLRRLENGATVTVSAPKAAAGVAVIAPSADLVTLTTSPSATGHVRLGDGSEVAIIGTSTFCAREGGCECPDRAGIAVVPKLPPGEIRVAVTGGVDPVSATLTGASLDCNAAPCPEGTWSLSSAIISSADARFTLTATGGTGALTIGPGTTARMDFDLDLDEEVSPAEAGGSATAHIDGDLDLELTIDPQTGAVTGTTTGGSGLSGTTTIDGEMYSLGILVDELVPIKAGVTSTCDAHAMTWSRDLSGGFAQWTWSR